MSAEKVAPDGAHLWNAGGRCDFCGGYASNESQATRPCPENSPEGVAEIILKDGVTSIETPQCVLWHHCHLANGHDGTCMTSPERSPSDADMDAFHLRSEPSEARALADALENLTDEITRIGSEPATTALSERDLEALRTVGSTALWISEECDEDPEVLEKVRHGCELLRNMGVLYLVPEPIEPATTEREPDVLRCEVANIGNVDHAVTHDSYCEANAAYVETLLSGEANTESEDRRQPPGDGRP